MHHLYDSNLGFEVEGASKAALTPAAIKLAREAHQFAVDSLADAALRVDHRPRLLRVIGQSGLPAPPNSAAGVPDEVWCRSLPTILQVFDILLPSVMHDLAQANLSGTDWAWMKQEVLKAAEGGCEYVAVVLPPGGQLMIADITSEAKPMPPIEDYNLDVFTLNKASGHLRIRAF